MAPGFDHTQLEKDLIEQFGGEPTESFGADGSINGDPVEVRLAKKEDRFRVNKDTHETLVDNSGTYIFDKLGDGKPPKEVPATSVDPNDGDDWHSDRGYKHGFIDVDEIF